MMRLSLSIPGPKSSESGFTGLKDLQDDAPLSVNSRTKVKGLVASMDTMYTLAFTSSIILTYH